MNASNERLQWRIEELEDEKRKRDRDDEERRRESLERRREKYEAARYEADDWPEAFQKQRRLLQQEVDLAIEAGADGLEDRAFWESEIAAVELAAKLYTEGWAMIQLDMKVRQKALLARMAEEIAATFPRSVDLVESLRTQSPSDLLAW